MRLKGISSEGLKRIEGSSRIGDSQMERVWNKVELIEKYMEPTEFVENLIKALGLDDAEEMLDYIIQMYDIMSLEREEDSQR